MPPKVGRNATVQRELGARSSRLRPRLQRGAESVANRSGRRDAARVQLLANQHAQADRGQPVGLSGATLYGRELRLLGGQGRRGLVGEQAHAGW